MPNTGFTEEPHEALPSRGGFGERRRSFGASDGYRWVGVHALDALCFTAVQHGDERAPAWIAALHEVAGRTGMRDYVVSAYLHEARLCAPDALAAAHTLAHTPPVQAAPIVTTTP